MMERFFFTSQGRTAIINADGTGLRYFDFQLADRVTWQPGPFLSDGRRVIFLSMEARRDGPGHDWSDLCIARPDGSEQRLLTHGQVCWFAATYGSPGNHGGGSNVPVWTRDGAILFAHRLPGSKVPWEFQPQRPDTDHFNRDFKPELARGGTVIGSLGPRTGVFDGLTRSRLDIWDFRASESPLGRSVVFCRAETGGSPAIWVMDADGRHPRLVTRGTDERGADHPRWLPEVVTGNVTG